jgi:FixJ family two-component response regulator
LSALDLAASIGAYLELPFIMEDAATQIVAAIDDDFRVRESLESLIESAGYEPAVFSSAEEFLQSGTLTAAAFVITDVRMPGMDGIELQRRVRLERSDVPIIFISAHDGAEIRHQALDEGGVGFLHKPFHAADLLALLQADPANAREK